jgi:hypothetical protein
MSDNGCSILETKWIEETINYGGGELRGHFVREISGITNDGVVAFAGSCDVRGKSLVDLEDFETGSTIEAEKMLHFIGEHFGCPLREANFRLRIFAAIIKDVFQQAAGDIGIKRLGDDLYIGERKLTVAISTLTPVSAIFHLGINIDPSGAPVQAVGIEEFNIETKWMANEVLEKYSQECKSIELAIRKVRGRY